MESQAQGPVTWLQGWASTLGWPIVVALAFWLGRIFQKVSTRAAKAEARIESLTDRHVPAIHRALAEIRGLLMGGR
jgi:hypothetical protein